MVMTAPATTAPINEEPLISRPSSRRSTNPASRPHGWIQPLGWLALAAAFCVYGILMFVGFTSLLGVLLVCLAMLVMLPWLGRVGAQAPTFDLAGLLRNMATKHWPLCSDGKKSLVSVFISS